MSWATRRDCRSAWPHSSAPPLARSSATRASAMACDPEAASGQPARCPRSAEEHADAGGDRTVERQERVRRDAGEQGRRVITLEARPAQRGGRADGVQPEAGHRDRVIGQRQRREDVVDQAEAAADDGGEQAAPRRSVDAEAGGCRLDRPLQQDGVVIERMGERSVRLDPAQTVAFERHASATPARRCPADGSPSTRRGRSRPR